MRTKRIVAPDMRQALKIVRDKLGADAVILSNRRVANGVEVTATLDYQGVVDAHKEKQRQRDHVPAYAEPGLASPAPTGDADRVLRPDLRALREEADRRHAHREAAHEKRVTSRQQSREFQRSVLERVSPLLARTGAEPEEDWRNQADIPAAPRQRRAAELEDDSVQLSSAARQATASMRDQVEARGAVPGSNHAPFSQPQPVAEPRAATAPPIERDNPMMAAMQAELAQLKTMLNKQLGSVAWGDFSYRHPLAAAIFRRLTQLGLSADISRSLLHGVQEHAPKKHAWQAVLRGLSQRIPLIEEDILDRGGVVALIGPAGVGKTTTIAKMAAQYVLNHGADSLALVTTDNFRLAGHEQLRSLARILKVPLRVVTENQTLDGVLRGLSRKRLILIDTAGLSSRDQTFQLQQSLLEQAHTPIEKWLVLSTTSQRRMLERAVAQYKPLGLAGCILTKLDESASLGEALSTVIEHQLAVPYVTDGQAIPDDLKRAKGSLLVNQAVELTRDLQLDDSIMADVFNEAQALDAEIEPLLA